MAWLTKLEGPKRGTRYRVQWRDPAGHHRSKTFRRRSDAEDFRRRTELDLSVGAWRDPKDARVLLGEYLEAWLDGTSHLRQSTRDLYSMAARRHVLPRFSETPIGAIRTQDVRVWLQDLAANGVGARTIQVSRQVLGLALGTAVEDGTLPVNAVRYAKQPPAPRHELVVPSMLDVRAIADAIEPRYRAMVLLAAFAGLRFGELAGLQRRDLRLLERRVEVQRQVVATTKGVSVAELKTRASRRSVPIPGSIADELAEHLATFVASDAAETHVFTTARGSALLRHRNFRPNVWLPALKRAGIRGVRFHDLRHHAATAMIAAGAHPAAIRERMGHTTIRTTIDVYGHLFPALDGELADRLDEAWRGAVPKGEVVALSTARR